MGFIKGNTNSFEVFLTDKGLQTFYRDGLNDSMFFFSVNDDDANYLQLKSSVYDPINIFDNPNNVISSIALGTGHTINGQHQVFTQTDKRGKILDGKINTKGVLTTNEPTLKHYVGYQGDAELYSSNYTLLTYRKINDTKQFNVKGVNGLYLSFPFGNLAPANRLYDIDAYPQSGSDVDFSYVNAQYFGASNVKYYIGSNDTKKLNKSVAYSSIVRSQYLILNESYDVDFDVHFTYDSADTSNMSSADKKISINIYGIFGRNKVALDFYTQGQTSPQVLYSDDQTQVDPSLAYITGSTLFLNDAVMHVVSGQTIAREVFVTCKTSAAICKKSKDFTILVDYNGKYGGSGVIAKLADPPGPHIDTVEELSPQAGSGSFIGNNGYTGGSGFVGCLFPGTMVELSNGRLVNVESIQVGDFLASTHIMGLDENKDDDQTYLSSWSSNTLTLDATSTIVRNKVTRTVDGLYVFNQGFKTSPTHIHFVFDGKNYVFKTSENIKLGDSLVKKNGLREVIYKIEVFQGSYEMYQLDTEIADVFFANGYITHNKLAPSTTENTYNYIRVQ